jgi:hypothetical protein
MRSLITVLCASLVLAGCTSNSVTTPVFPGAGGFTPLVQHLYVGNDNTPGTVLRYTLPLTAGSTPNFAIASNNIVSVAVDGSGDLAVGDNAGHLQFFTAPLSAASVPAASFANGVATNNGQIVFSTSGNMYVPTVSNSVNYFTAPFSNASVPAQTVTNPALVSVIGAAIDTAQNFYASNAGAGTALTCSSGAGTCSDVIVGGIFAPIVPATAYRKIAVTATQLFADNVAGGTGRVDVYTLPITAASVPAFAITTGVNTPEAVAVDAVGNLYVGNLGNATVAVYAPPFSAASAPTLSFQVNAGAFAIFGMAIGP